MMKWKNKLKATAPLRRAALMGGALSAFLALTALAGCGQIAQDAYIATDGDLTIGIGQYKQGEWVNAACNWQTGKVDISSTHITSSIPIKLSGKHLYCDTANHKLIGAVKVQSPAQK